MPAYTTFDEIEPLETEYLLAGEPKIPRGDVTLFFGDGSVGKGRMLCSFIAEVVNAGGTVLTVSPEDHPHEETAPRLRAAGVRDLSKVIDMTRLPGGSRLKLSADMKHDGDIGQLRQAVEELNEAGHRVRLLVIDPIAAVVGFGSISTNAGARRLVEPLQDLAMSTGIAVCLVAHTVKSGVLQGSAGLSQALRLVYRVTKDPANPLLRVLHAEKANNVLVEDLRFTIEEDAAGRVRVVWLTRAAQDERNRAWRATPADDTGSARAAAAASGPRYVAAAGIQKPGESQSAIRILDYYPATDSGARLARLRCEMDPAFPVTAQWRPGQNGEQLAKVTAPDGGMHWFAVTAMTTEVNGNR